MLDHKLMLLSTLLALIVMLLLGTFTPGATAAQDTTPAPQTVPVLYPLVISERPHASDAYTQGLLLHDGLLYESTGQYGESDLREVDPETGEVLRQLDLSDEYFGEGLALVDDRLIQLTYHAGLAFVYDLETFDLLETFEYEGEGWGLCYDGDVLWMTNGSSDLFMRDPETFEILETVAVTRDGLPVPRLNELECVDGTIYANVYLTDEIVHIDPTTGEVIAVIDAAFLLPWEERGTTDTGAVLNGIAYDPENEVFLITGKLWPKLFEVTFVEAVG